MRISRGGIELHAEVLPAAGESVLFLHGLGGSAASWEGAVGGLKGRANVVLVDLRGCGSSACGSAAYTMETLAADVVAWIDALDLRRCHLVGHSFGGVLAQEVLTRHGARVASAVLVSTSSLVGKAAAENWKRLAATVREHGLRPSTKAAAQAFSEAFAAAHPEIVRRQRDLLDRADPTVYAAQAELSAGYDYTRALAAVEQPVLVLQGKADRMTPVGGSVLLARALRNARLELIEGAGHNLHVELGRRFGERVFDFVTGTA